MAAAGRPSFSGELDVRITERSELRSRTDPRQKRAARFSSLTHSDQLHAKSICGRSVSLPTMRVIGSETAQESSASLKVDMSAADRSVVCGNKVPRCIQ